MPIIVLLLAPLACALPVLAPTPNSNTINTFIAQTMIAAAARTASAIIPASRSPQAPTLTFTPGPPTLTPSITLTTTPLFTPTPLVPQISVSVATNCRSGPGKVYDLEGALLVGETAEVLARDPSSNYWYIRNPDSPGEFCWVWGEYATLAGNLSVLPVYTPPPTPTPTLTPTPTPDFEASYTSLDTCAGWWVEIRLKNIGAIPFRSIGITVKDKDTDVQLSNYVDGFTDINGCLTSTTRDRIDPGKTYVISAPAFTYDPSGHKIVATINLCSSTGQSGTCITKMINFKP